jgi:hypothetical protein
MTPVSAFVAIAAISLAPPIVAFAVSVVADVQLRARVAMTRMAIVVVADLMPVVAIVAPVGVPVMVPVVAPVIVAVVVANRVMAFDSIVPVSTTNIVLVNDDGSRVKSKEKQVGHRCHMTCGDVSQLVIEARFKIVVGLCGSRPAKQAKGQAGCQQAASDRGAFRLLRRSLEFEVAIH